MAAKAPKIIFLLIILYIAFPLSAQDNAESVYKNSLKMTFLSFITGSAKLTYERVTFPKQSVELTAGIIGIGFDRYKNNPRGGLIRAGYKFNLWQPENATLTGFYIRPEYAWSFFDYNSEDENKNRIHSSMQTILFCIGYQHTIKRLVLDGFVGAGAGWGKPVDFQYHHGFIERFDHLTLTFGVKIGVGF